MKIRIDTNDLNFSLVNDELAEAKKEYRFENILDEHKRLVEIHKRVSSISATTVGVIAGAGLGLSTSKLFTKKLKARIAYLKSKGQLISPKDKQELKSLEAKLTRVHIASSAVGALGGAVAANEVLSKIRSHANAKSRKRVFNTEIDK